MKEASIITKVNRMVHLGRISRALRPADIVSIAYFTVLSLLILIFHENLKGWGFYLGIHAVVILLIFALIRAALGAKSGIVMFFRDWYPALLAIFGFEEMGLLVTLIFPYWANSFVMGLDKAVFGVHPTVWLEKFSVPWLNEIMVFFLFAYFLMLPVGGGIFYIRGKKTEFQALLFNVVLSYFICFLLFLVFPAEGPWVIMKGFHAGELEGGPLFNLYYSLQQAASIRGGCFPSSHVAGAFAVAFSFLSRHKKTGFALLFVASGVAVGTVFTRYHHAVDSIAGILLAAACVLIGTRVSRSWEKKHR